MAKILYVLAGVWDYAIDIIVDFNNRFWEEYRRQMEDK